MRLSLRRRRPGEIFPMHDPEEAEMTVRRVGWSRLAATEAALTGLIWFGLFLATFPHYRCPQDDVGVRGLSWMAFVLSGVLLLTLASVVAYRRRIYGPGSIIISALVMLPLLLLGAYFLYGINSDWHCGNM